MRIAFGVIFQTDQPQQITHPPPPFPPPPIAQAEADIVGEGQMREQRQILKHHADPPLFRRQGPTDPAQFAPLQMNRTPLERFETGDGAQQGGLAAAARAEQAADAGLLHPQRHPLNHLARRIGDIDLVQLKERCHSRISTGRWRG